MAHPRWPGFNDKTGNPPRDNRSRRMNRKMWRDTQRKLKVHTPGGRRRKKHLLRVEGGNYIRLIVAVMNDMYAEREANRPPAETGSTN